MDGTNLSIVQALCKDLWKEAMFKDTHCPSQLEASSLDTYTVIHTHIMMPNEIENMHWKLALGEKSLAALENGTCLSSMPDLHSTNWATSPSHISQVTALQWYRHVKQTLSMSVCKVSNRSDRWRSEKSWAGWTAMINIHSVYYARAPLNLIIIHVMLFDSHEMQRDSTDNSSTDKVETSLEWQEYNFSQFQDMTDKWYQCAPLSRQSFCTLVNHVDPHSWAPKKNASHENEVLLQYTTHLIQRPCYQRGSLCQDPAGNWTTQRPPDHHKIRDANCSGIVMSPFIRSGQHHLARHSERGKKTRQTEEEVGKQHQGKDRPGVRQVSGYQRALKNREKWRKLVVKSSVVLQWPSQLSIR